MSIVLGIESTAHTFGCGICKNGKILSNEMSTYKPLNEGMVPGKVAEHHSKKAAGVIKKALEMAKMNMKDIEIIAVSQGPGIGAPLRTGIVAAKYLAKKFKKEMVGVNHPFAHLFIAKKLSGFSNPLYVYASGGNTQIIKEENNLRFRVLGETLDIGMGNLFDSIARTLGIAYGHGSELEKLAKEGKYIPLPYTVKGMNLSFSGLRTHAERKTKNESVEDIAYSVMHTAFAELCEVSERAIVLEKKNSVVLCGGVAQNRMLQKMMKEMCKEHGAEMFVAPDEYNRDNGAMIALAGEEIAKRFGVFKKEIKAMQDYRIDEMVEVIKNHII